MKRSTKFSCPRWSAWLTIIAALFAVSGSSFAAPVISSISPSSATAGGPAFTLTVNGSGFGGLLITPTVQWNGAARQTTFLSGSQLTAQILASDIATAGTAKIRVVNQPLVGSSEHSNEVPFAINNPVPSISSLSPATIAAGGPDFTLTVNGSNFVTDATVRFGNSNRNTTFVSSSQLTAEIRDNDISQPGTRNVTVINPGPGGGTSNALSFTVTPALTITTSSPLPAGIAGSPYSQTLTASGGTPPYSWSIIAGALPAGLTLASSTGVLSGTPSGPGSFNFTVRVTDAGEPTPAAASKAFTLTVAAPGPLLASINPSSANAGGPGFTLTVNGSNFVSGSTVRWNGSNRTTAFVSASQLTASIPASDIASPGTATVVVANPGGSISNSLAFTVSPALLTITTVSPLPSGSQGAAYSQALSAAGGQPPYSWSVVSGSLPNGISLNASSAVLSGTPSAAGSFGFTVRVSDSSQPTPETATKAFTLVVAASVPQLNSINPSSANAGGPAFTLTVNGANFVSNSTVRWNGSSRITAFVSGAQLTAAIPAADIAAPGTASVTVADPGATSNALTFTISTSSLTITTASPLPQGIVGNAYSQTVVASGGTLPYSWSVSAGALPAGLTLNASSGTIGGTPTAVGNSTFTARVQDSASSSATKQFELSIHSATTPTFVISGVTDNVEPAQQPSIEITLSSAYRSPISGQLTLRFDSNADALSDDPIIQFSTGGRTVNFSIPANSTRAIFSNNGASIAFQTGTVAGTISLSLSAQSEGSTITPSPPPGRTLTLSRRAPVITRLNIASRSASGFELAITGFSTPRSLTQASFRFTPVQGANLQSSTVTVSLATSATSWFQSPTATSVGGQFRLLMPFTVQGDVNSIQSVSVTLTNAEGTYEASSVQF